MTRRFELQSQNRKSFYGKCYVEEDGNVATLFSYHTPVMSFDTATREIKTLKGFNYSATTKRHQKAFMDFYEITETERNKLKEN